MGKDDLKWVANTTTLIYGEQGALLVDTFLSDAQTGGVGRLDRRYRNAPVHRRDPRHARPRDASSRLLTVCETETC